MNQFTVEDLNHIYQCLSANESTSQELLDNIWFVIERASEAEKVLDGKLMLHLQFSYSHPFDKTTT